MRQLGGVRQLSKPLTNNPKATFPLPQRGGVRGGNLEGVKATPLTPKGRGGGLLEEG